MNKKGIEVKGNIYGAGVYCLKTYNDEVLYVGSSIEINDALSRHLFNLKRNNYYDTNKRVLQLAYDRQDLVFEVLDYVYSNDEIKSMTREEKAEVQRYLGLLEESYIGEYEDTICNKQMSVTKSSSSNNRVTTYKRRMANIGSKNPNNKYDEEIIANVLWLKVNGYKPKEIAKIMAKIGVDISTNYISMIGISKWIFVSPKLTISADILLDIKAN